MNIPNYIIVHNVGASSNLSGVNAYHRSKSYPKSDLGYYVGYHYFLKKTGEIVQTRKDNEVGAHTLLGYNFKSIGICLEGNFSIELPNESQIKSLKNLIIDLKNKYNIPLENIGPHRKFHPNHTECYGSNLSDDWVQSLIIDKTREKLINNLSNRGQGTFVISVEENGELYVINKDGSFKYLSKPEDMFEWVKDNAIGISKDNLNIIKSN